MRAAEAGIASVVTAALAWALATSSGLSVPWHPADATALRLSWSARPERIERCRTLTEAELATRPLHMRQATECEGRAASYALLVVADGDTLEESVVRGGGLRSDRPIFLHRSYVVREGKHRVQVRFTRREAVDSAASPNAIAPVLMLDTLLAFRRGEVVLVTYDDGALQIRER